MRSQVLSVKQEDFVHGGPGDGDDQPAHPLPPHSAQLHWTPIMVREPSVSPLAVIEAAALGFLGLVLSRPQPE